MKQYLNQLISHTSLSEDEAKAALLKIGQGEVNPSQMAAFLMGIQAKGVTVDELIGFREAMLELAVIVDLTEFDAMDLCGTGGDGKDTFNISTTASFIVAGAGQKVAKHGNHGVSSSVGSSTVLEYLGVKFSNDQDFLKHKIETAGICYLHAPLFHPAMRHIGPIRKELGIKTFFNMLGPLLNPAKVEKQLTGIYDLSIFDLYHQLFNRSVSQYGILHSLDGYDEISLTGDFKLATNDFNKNYSPSDIGLEVLLQDQLHGGDSLEASAKIMVSILENEGTPAQNAAVLANAGVALSVSRGLDLAEGIALARVSLESGKALESFRRLVE
ncbi:anthranilate phosphoribosyltransferase [Emticicia sp. CRIBPO]|uniref:anthranilate phosphoribosyltransferase n=1 Tax=Emticicia sp. CRIBPO TaxID=2683258 RepID=UPI0014120C6C|nr:anthranilate phosphoribosyltransferase [Emticicia sp. CRIBPO]NBA88809.1 anthranilate phosphoribosyltransferase [Emticicia sp. CRIBPO]